MSTRRISSKRLFVPADPVTFDAPVGTILAWPSPTVPVGWTECYGQAVKRADYQKLFDLVGTAFGVGDGSTTFNLPDCRGRHFLGKDNLGGTSANRVTATQADNIGQGAGAENHQLTTAELPSHAHRYAVRSAFFGAQPGGNSKRYFAAAIDSPSGSAGGDQVHNNVSPYVTMSYIIKA